ncbi:cytidylyltransferase domain-containing protein [Halovivax limisalsi]|uniref:acylneuraminate cytidylyltransferase family protein n=1 Tax=Halovivax limisalsi TaxID=1453760 RepID=UPI001FFC42D9|nr:acylneuraminate cytidylyltransferase family protein [Halovivax limisalsi]
MSERSVVGIVPARGGSKGIPRKNVRELAGRPLIAHSIRAGTAANSVDTVIVSTDDEEIADTAEEYGARVPFMRPPTLATDEAPTSPVIAHALETLAEAGETYDDFVLLQPTSPLRTAADVDDAYSHYRNRDVDSLFSAYPTTETRWKKTEQGAIRRNYTDASKRRQDREPEWVCNGGIYITAVDAYWETEEILTGTTAIYEMDEITSIDIDTPFDLWLAEQVMTRWNR